MTPRKKKEETVEVKDYSRLIVIAQEILDVINPTTGKREARLKELLEILLNEIK